MSVGFFLILAGVLLLLPTAYAAKIGAPWAPTRLAVVKKAFDQLSLGPSDVLVDLGAGDGKILLEVARRGAKVVGYELSPIMWVIAKLRLYCSPLRRGSPKALAEGKGLLRALNHPYPSFVRRGKLQVLFRNFYNQKLPAETTIIFAFLMPANMPRVRTFLQGQHLPAAKYVMTYAFPFKEIDPLTVVREKNCAPLYVYVAKELVSKP